MGTVSRRRWSVMVLLTLLLGGWPLPVESAVASTRERTTDVSADLSDLGWVWPTERWAISRPFVQPAHAYAPGHRGMDLDLLGWSVVRAPAEGVIAFAGDVAGRPVVTIQHLGDLVSTLEPVRTDLAQGAQVHRGEDIGVLGIGGHSPPGVLHFGVRLRGEYINPMLLWGGIERAILLPCCD